MSIDEYVAHNHACQPIKETLEEDSGYSSLGNYAGNYIIDC